MTDENANSVQAQQAPNLTRRRPCSRDPSKPCAIATIGLFVLIHAFTVAAFIVLLRRNVGGGLASTGAAFLHLIALVGLILLLHRPARRIFGSAQATVGAIALGSAVGFLLPLSGFLLGPWGLLTPAAAATAGLFTAAKAIGRGSGWRMLPIPVVAGVASGLLQSILSNGNIYAHVFSHEFTLLGWQAPDPVFHPAIAALISTYGIPTIGVDGTRPLFYHVLSHYLVAGFAREAAETALLAYPAVQQVFLLPCVLLGSAMSVGYLCGFSRASSVLAPIATILAWRVYDRLGGFNTFVESESYAAGIGLFLLGLPLLLQGPGRGRSRLLSWSALLGLIGAMSILAKFTLAFAWIVAAVGRFWEQQRNLLPGLAKFALAAGVLLYCACLYVLFTWLGGIDATRLLAYAQFYPDSYWLSIEIGVAAVFAAALLARFGKTAIPSPLLVLCFVALLHVPDLFLVDVGGGQYYWFDATDRLAIAVLTAAAIAVGGRIVRGRDWALSTAAALLTTAMLYVTLTNPNFIRSANNLATTLIALDRLDAIGGPPRTAFLPERSHELARQILAPDRPPPSAEDPATVPEAVLTITLHLASGAPAGIREAVAHAPLARAVRTVNQTLSGIDTPRPGLFVGPENDWYWLGPYTCTTRNFNFQALTGLALLAGIPDANENCPDVGHYGVRFYGEESRSSKLDRGRFCAAAAERGLSPILIVTGPDRPVEIACRP